MFPTHENRLRLQAERARRIAALRECPHCHQRLEIVDAIALLRGNGFRSWVSMELPNGLTAWVREEDFNPTTMLWASRGSSRMPALGCTEDATSA